MILHFRPVLRMALMGIAPILAACGDSTDPGPQPPGDVAVTATGATSARITFSGQSGNQYIIQRAEGGTSIDFEPIATVDGPATGSTVTYDDAGLLASTTYRYRVGTVRGGQTSTFSAIRDVTTGAPGSGGEEIVEGDITTNRTFTADKSYIIRGFVHVTQGATLTIQPGTTIKGDYATEGSSLFVLRGAKIVAVGTPDLPIVFTSSRPVGSRAPGDWGGLIIVGNGVVNRAGDVEIEGTGTATGTSPGTNYRVLYTGGSSNEDDSGELRYVRVEYAGFAPSVGQELNSFTFAAVGRTTKLSYLQALAGLDDSFEWFGGSVDADHLVSYESGDDHFDMSEGYVGRVQFAIAFRSTLLTPTRPSAGGTSTDPQGIENDGCNAPNPGGCPSGFNSAPLTIPLVANFTLVGTGNTASSGSTGGVGIVLRRGTGGYYMNGIVARWPRAGIAVRDAETYARAGSVATPDLATTDLAVRNVLFANGATAPVFETGSGRSSFDLAGNNLTHNTTAAATDIFAALPATTSSTTTASSFDWTPATGSVAATTAGSGAFAGKVATKAQGATSTGLAISGTTYVGAAQPAGTKWWAGWTRYAQQ
jgi:hypothetical protein